MSSDKPTLRWGIVATGMISSWFASDLAIERKDAQANHIIQAVGSSSLEKAQAFIKEHIPGVSPVPTAYGSYDEVYTDPNVDIIYVGTPHSVHKKNCLDAIRHGKHVLCEKPFAVTAVEARGVFAAAKDKGVFLMEAMWTRFFPALRAVQRVVHEERRIGDVFRATADFSLEQGIADLHPEHRLRNPALGGGGLLDIGIYALTWAVVAVETPRDKQEGAAEMPKIAAALSLTHGVDVGSSAILLYKDGRQGVATSSSRSRNSAEFCRIEGTKGSVTVEGPAAPTPESFTVRTWDGKEEKVEFGSCPGRGFYYEADAVALDIAAGRTQSALMPWSETQRMMEILDEIRRQGGARFPQDGEA